MADEQMEILDNPGTGVGTTGTMGASAETMAEQLPPDPAAVEATTNHVIGTTPPPDPGSREQQEAGFAEARSLCESDIDINTAFHALVTARYTHQIAREKLLKLVKAKAKESLTEAMVVSASIFEAEHNTLSPQQVRDRYVNILTPFIIATVGAYETEEKAQRQTDMRLAEDARSKRPLVIDELTLDRNRPIMVPVFWLPMVSLLFDQLLMSLPEDHNFRIIRLTNSKANPDAAGKCVEVPLKLFQDMAQSPERFQHAITTLVHGKMRQPSVDLILIDNLLTLGPPPITGMDPARHAAALQKNMRKGLREVGAAMIAGFQSNLSPSTDPKDSTWGPLAQFTRLLSLNVHDPIDEIRLVEWGPLSFRVEQEDWDKAHGVGLIVPSN